MAVTTPLPLIVAILPSPPLQLPPPVASYKVTLLPGHKLVLPPIAFTTGELDCVTVTILLLEEVPQEFDAVA